MTHVALTYPGSPLLGRIYFVFIWTKKAPRPKKKKLNERHEFGGAYRVDGTHFLLLQNWIHCLLIGARFDMQPPPSPLASIFHHVNTCYSQKETLCNQSPASKGARV